LLPLAALGLGLHPALAQPDLRPLGTVPPFVEIVQPQSLRFFNALIHHHEWGLEDDSLLSIGNAYSLLQPGRPLDAFLAHYHERNQDFALGSQLLDNATPIYEQLLFQGGRWGFRQGEWSGGLWFGQSQNALQELQGLYQRQQLGGASLAWTPDDFHAYGVTVMPYASVPGGGIDRTLTMAQLYQGGESESGAGYGLSAGYGRDSASGNSAFRILGGYHSDQLDLSFSTRSQGSQFGPPTGLFDLRGTSFSNLTGVLRFSPNWSFLEADNLSDVFMGTGQATHVSSYSHSLRYQDEDSSLTVGLQQLGLATPGSQLNTNSLFLNGYTRMGSWTLNGQARRNRGNLNSNELGLGVTVPLSDWLSLRAQEFYTSGQAGQSSLATNAGLYFQLGELGQADIGYFRQDNIQNTVFSRAPRDSLVANAHLNLLGNLKLNATVNPQTFSLINLRWIADEHQEFVLEHRFQNGENRFFYNDFTSVPLGHVTTLTWNASWGGPMERRLRSELEGRLQVQVGAPNVTVAVGERRATSDERGVAYFGQLAPGTYRVRLLDLPEVLELVGSSEQEVEVEPGRSAQPTFESVPHSGLEIVVFQDPEALGRIPGVDYQPVAGARVELNGLPLTSGPDGRIRDMRLEPGAYRVSLDPSSLEAGMELTTPAERSGDLKAGQTRRLEFGVRGFGQGELELLEYLPGALDEAGARPVEVGVLVGGRLIGRSDGRGRLLARLPVGATRFQVDLADAGPVGSLLIRPNQTSQARLAFYHKAEVQVQVQGLPAGAGLALRLLGPDGFEKGPVYLGSPPRYDFRQLAPGRYRVLVERDTLPAGLGADPLELRVGSGDRLKVVMPLKEVKP
jgi:hypothetical protein